MREFQEAKRYHGMDELYQFINPEDDEEELELTIVERNEDTMYLRWTGEEPDPKKIKHHIPRHVKWIVSENIKTTKEATSSVSIVEKWDLKYSTTDDIKEDVSSG